MSTIYRKYRPQVFADVTGQEHIIQTITNEIANGKTAHAYLFSGPRGTGKTTLARLLAKAVNCQNKKDGKFEPCNECSSCNELMGGNSIDIIEVDAASHTGVDNVRENIIENAQFKPTKSKYKVFIIDEVHMLSTSAFNALLKTLEEPPAHAIFILATTEAQKLPATIISRCQRFNFKKVGFDNMIERLEGICKSEKIKVDKKVLERIVNKSDGCVRDAESLLGQILSLDLKNISSEDAEMILPTSNIGSILEFINLILDKQAAAGVEMIQKLIDDGVNLEQFAYDTIEALRLAMITQTTAKTKNINTDYAAEDLKSLKKTSEKISTPHIIKMLESLIVRHREIKSAPLPQLPLELFVVEFSMLGDQPTTGGHLEFAPVTKIQTEETAPSKPNQPSTPILSAQESISPSINIEKPQEPAHNITQTIKDTISHITHKDTKTTFEEIKSKWDKIIEEISKANHSLSFILKMSSLQTLEGNQLHITVPYSFHKDKISEINTKKIIEQTLTSSFSEHITLACEVAEESRPQNNEDDSELNKLAADFGGELA
ncbi:MAG: DNA polymerase III, subunit gamma and tau [Candidatus Magasanikbacteria bacterium RIFOXYD2_FULL_39_9]|uniref:DNA polymerase III subunit gamma/tau n=1 Tax=Candidatus Magasanikbacteria bacterium RIFOXYD1_FULL_40_23 TaxID=1798705 RepID=A0A1F6PB69_9BACT|nr:MAG: DNA polymerase III, subunit gamma and tau [Candidatus Magasanikbacteria bacterium RIFOXYD2_FULL_39_9]OGH93415.1 MAG: DNA polymerase III, subunit gamma and tau [Candidatus Magasanikbacteria bacterium RIFOXYD1_FULL_40_23]